MSYEKLWNGSDILYNQIISMKYLQYLKLLKSWEVMYSDLELPDGSIEWLNAKCPHFNYVLEGIMTAVDKSSLKRLTFIL